MIKNLQSTSLSSSLLACTTSRDVTDFESDFIPLLFNKSESVRFADLFSIGFGFDFRFEFQKNQLLSANSLTLIVKIKRACNFTLS